MELTGVNILKGFSDSEDDEHNEGGRSGDKSRVKANVEMPQPSSLIEVQDSG